MTRNFQSDNNQIPGYWNIHNNVQHSSLPLQVPPPGHSARVNPFTSQEMNQTISNPWHNHENRTNNLIFHNSLANTNDSSSKASAFSWNDNSVANSLSKNLSELNIRDDRPRPTKIRRRNALTILDQHFPNPNTIKNGTSPLLETPSSTFDAFEGASLLQSINEQSSEQNGSLSCSVEFQQPKRKVPSASNSSTGNNTMSSYHTKKRHQRRQRKLQEKIDEEKISHISLHEDLNNFKPKHDILPDKIFQKLKETQGERTMLRLDSTRNTCSALVLYRPPEALLFDINRRSAIGSIKSEEQNNCESIGSSLQKDFAFVTSTSLTESCIEVEMSE